MAAMSILRQIDNFYLTAEQLEKSPSRNRGVDAETEKRLRVYGCDRIQRAAILLDMPQVVAATAQILFHRFYSKKDVREWHVRVRSSTDGARLLCSTRFCGAGCRQCVAPCTANYACSGMMVPDVLRLALVRSFVLANDCGTSDCRLMACFPLLLGARLHRALPRSDARCWIKLA
jgi:hypothetical protein